VEFEELHDGHPAVSVPEFAERMDASLIVASSHGRSGLSRLTVGSVTSGFVRHATCPVMIVRLPHPTHRWDDVDARVWAM
jgi:nucleotide-binding universal stress UspA family protein